MSLITFIATPVCNKICIFSKNKSHYKVNRIDLKKILYKMLIKYYLSDNIKATFKDFALGLQNAWAGPG